MKRGAAQTQRGVALIMALLIVALATTAAVSMVSRQQLDIRRTGNTLNAGQAYQYVVGMEGWAGQILRRDREDNEVDHLGEEWATVLPPIPIDGGQLAGAITDLQGRFNLNRLAPPRAGVGNSVDPKAVEQSQLALERFQRLLRALGLDPALATAVVDWLDPDIEPSFPNGGEDGVYLNMEVPYRTANRPMASVTELRLVAGITPEIYAKLEPYVTALPSNAGLNVNTIPADRPELFMAIAEGLTKQGAEALIAARGDEGFSSVDGLLREDALAGLGDKVKKEGLATATRYFMVSSSVLVGSGSLAMNSVLERDDRGATRVVFRAQETF